MFNSPLGSANRLPKTQGLPIEVGSTAWCPGMEDEEESQLPEPRLLCFCSCWDVWHMGQLAQSTK